MLARSPLQTFPEGVTAADEDSSSAHAALVGTAGRGFAMAVGVLVSVAMGLLW